MTRAEQLRADYNRVFYPNGHPNRDARIFFSGTLNVDGEEYPVPSLGVGELTTFREVVRILIAMLANVPPQQEEKQVQPAKKKQELVDIKHRSYRGTPYIVQHLREGEEDVFVIIRDAEPDKGKVLSEKSPAYRSIVKAYLEEKEAAPARQGEEE